MKDQGASRAPERLSQIAAHIAAGSTNDAAHPALIVVLGWTAAPRSALEKSTATYGQLYPRARKLLFPVGFGDFLPWPARTAADTARGLDELMEAIDVAAPHVLIHVLSGGGAARFAALATLYREARGQPLPAQVLLCDSAPTDAGVLSRARTMSDHILFANSAALVRGAARLTLSVALAAAHLWTVATAQQDLASAGWEALLDPSLVSPLAVRGYVYSTADKVVTADEVERHIAQAKQLGAEVLVQVYDDSPHMLHTRLHPESYWAFVARLWECSVNSQRLQTAAK